MKEFIFDLFETVAFQYSVSILLLSRQLCTPPSGAGNNKAFFCSEAYAWSPSSSGSFYCFFLSLFLFDAKTKKKKEKKPTKNQFMLSKHKPRLLTPKSKGWYRHVAFTEHKRKLLKLMRSDLLSLRLPFVTALLGYSVDSTHLSCRSTRRSRCRWRRQSEFYRISQ